MTLRHRRRVRQKCERLLRRLSHTSERISASARAFAIGLAKSRRHVVHDALL